MNEKNTEYLFNKYTEIFKGKDQPITENLMAFGFECGDGWLSLIDCLCKQITNYCKQHKIDLPKAEQVKEKFGGLRFYVSSADDTIYNYIDFAESMSYLICEKCGTTRDVETKGIWICTLCEKCRSEK